MCPTFIAESPGALDVEGEGLAGEAGAHPGELVLLGAPIKNI